MKGRNKIPLQSSKKVKNISNKMKIKPLSINKCFLGRKRKTADYRNYERSVISSLDNRPISAKGKLQLDIIVGLSSTLADIDNPLKPLIDILQQLHSFNDNRIFKLSIEKVRVEKGEDFFWYKLSPYDEERKIKLFEELK